MALRPFNLHRDTTILAEVLPRAFQYPDHPEWSLETDQLESLLDGLAALRRLRPVIAALQALFPFARDIMRGYVWEEDGQPVGVVNVVRQGASGKWEIGNVAVLPEYRRRGIARALVEAALALAQERGAERVLLEVVEGNLPASALYESLGFTTYTRSLEMVCEPGDGPPQERPLLPEGYMLAPLDPFDWQTRLTLAERITPEPVRRFDRPEAQLKEVPGLFRALISLFERSSGAEKRRYVLRTLDGTPVAIARCSARQRAGGTNTLSLSADPAHPEPVEALLALLLGEVLRLAPDRRVELVALAWQPPVVAAAERIGFRRRCTYQCMGLNLQT